MGSFEEECATSFEDIIGNGQLQLVVLFGGLRCLGTVPQLSRYANGSTKRYFVSVLHICRENGVDINPGLFSAAREGHEAVVSALLAAGARTVDWRRAGVYAPFVFVLGFFEVRVTLFRHQFQHCRRRTRRIGDNTDAV